MMKNERLRHDWIRISLGVTTLFMVGCLHRVEPVPHRPVHPAEQAAQQAVKTYAEMLAQAFDEAGQQIAAGTLKTADEVNQHLQSSNSSARKQAFHPLDELLNQELGGEKWHNDDARELFQHISSGFRSAR